MINLGSVVPLLTDGETTDDCLTDDEELANVADAGQLSISFSTTNGQVSSSVTPKSTDGENKGMFSRNEMRVICSLNSFGVVGSWV